MVEVKEKAVAGTTASNGQASALTANNLPQAVGSVKGGSDNAPGSKRLSMAELKIRLAGSSTPTPAAEPEQAAEFDTTTPIDPAEYFADLDGDAVNSTRPKPETLSFVDLVEREINVDNILLGARWICRGGAVLIVAPSGVGKSTWIIQAIVEWSVGRVAFGIVPNGALRILVVQAENDDDDNTEIARGVNSGLNLSDAEYKQAGANTAFIRIMASGEPYLIELDKLLAEHKPDILVADPLSAYIGGDSKDPALIADFCRNGLNKLLFKHNCGLIIIHHTPKTSNRDTSKWSAIDQQYAGAGGADLTNWARAVLTIDPVSPDDGIFRLIASKRKQRIGWTDDEGYPVYERVIRHSRERGVIRWEDATQDEVDAIRRKDAKGKPMPEPSDLLQFVEDGELIGKSDLIDQAYTNLKIGINKAQHLVKVAVERGTLHEHRIKRHRKRDAVMLGTYPQSDVSSNQSDKGKC